MPFLSLDEATKDAWNLAGGIIPLVNLFVIVSAALYGIQLVRASVKEFLELLHEMHEKVMEYERRVTKLETEHETVKQELQRLRDTPNYRPIK